MIHERLQFNSLSKKHGDSEKPKRKVDELQVKKRIR